MSEKPKGFVVIKITCWKCGGDMFWQGKREREWSPHPKVKGSFQWHDFVCEKCGEVVRTGGFLKE